MQFKSLAEIQAHSFAGNHYGDHAAFIAIEAFARDESNLLYDRAEALRIMGREGMGLSPEDNLEHLSDKEFISDYMENLDV